MPSRAFPSSILQTGIKITNEPPQGLRANLTRSYAALDESTLSGCKKPVALRRLLFAFCFFHAIVQDRRKFGPIGWSIPYDFTPEDLIVCQRQLRVFLDAGEDDTVPYKVLNFLGAQINYGGRVTDDKDKRLITCILSTYVCPDVVEKGPDYWFSSSGQYVCPAGETHRDFVDYIKTLPAHPEPEVFGLHDNASLASAEAEAMGMLEGILSMGNRKEGSKGQAREEILCDATLQLLDRIPESFDVESVKKSFPTEYMQSMNTILGQEVIRYNRLINVTRSSLVEFQKALKGAVLMSDSLECVGNSIFDNQVPKLWADRGFLSMKPLSSWIEDLQQRVRFISDWIRSGTPTVFWLSGLFFPQAFLTGTLQNYAREKVVAIDRLSFQFVFMDSDNPTSITTPAKEGGCYVHGLFIEGARWDSTAQALAPSRSKVVHETLPIILFRPVVDATNEGRTSYSCPIYKVPSRRGTLSTTGHSTNFVASMDIPVNDPPETWIKAGVAVFLSLRY